MAGALAGWPWAWPLQMWAVFTVGAVGGGFFRGLVADDTYHVPGIAVLVPGGAKGQVQTAAPPLAGWRPWPSGFTQYGLICPTCEQGPCDPEEQRGFYRLCGEMQMGWPARLGHEHSARDVSPAPTLGSWGPVGTWSPAVPRGVVSL